MTSRHIEKIDGRYRVSSSLLLLFSMPFIVWQMGVLFFSGTTMSLFGRTPIPLAQEDTSLVILAGYLASIIALCLFPRHAVYMLRAVLPAALVSTVLMLFPFDSSVLTMLFCLSAFCCVFSIGVMLCMASQHFTLDTVWRDGIISMVGGGVLIAIMSAFL